MKNYPKISIVTHSLNRENYIAETIESVLNQNYPNLEYVVIDDGSTDKSWEIIKQYRGKLFYAERIEGSRNNPIYALNYGFKKTTGEILGWLNTKNILLPKSLFTIAEVFSVFPQIEWLTGIGSLIDDESKIVAISPFRKDFYEHLIDMSDNLQQESTFWRRGLWERTGGQLDERYPWAFDVALWCTKFFLNARLYHLNTLIGAYRKTPQAKSSTSRREFLDYIEKTRQEMRSKVSRKEILFGEIFRIIRYLKPLLKNIPDGLYACLPIIKNFTHEAVKFYKMENGRYLLKIHKRNPFRTIFPW